MVFPECLHGLLHMAGKKNKQTINPPSLAGNLLVLLVNRPDR